MSSAGGHFHRNPGVVLGRDAQVRAPEDRFGTAGGQLHRPFPDVHVASRLFPLPATQRTIKPPRLVVGHFTVGPIDDPQSSPLESPFVGRIEPQANDLAGRVPERPQSVDVHLAIAHDGKRAVLLLAKAPVLAFQRLGPKQFRPRRL